jgi:hypothetical protein
MAVSDLPHLQLATEVTLRLRAPVAQPDHHFCRPYHHVCQLHARSVTAAAAIAVNPAKAYPEALAEFPPTQAAFPFCCEIPSPWLWDIFSVRSTFPMNSCFNLDSVLADQAKLGIPLPIM